MRYGCSVYVFEPHPKYYAHCVERFRDNPKIHVFDFGVSDKHGEFLLTDDEDGSSFQNGQETGSGIKCRTRRFSDALQEIGVARIDLMKINIEGGEYPLLTHILSEGLTEIVKDFQIQFHNFVPDAISKRELIQHGLKETHYCTWNYDFVWENWAQKHEK